MHVVFERVQVRCCYVRQPNWLALVGNALFVSNFRKAYFLVGKVEAKGVIVGRGIFDVLLEAVTDTFDFATAFVVRAGDVRFHLLNSIVVHGLERNGPNCDKRSIRSLPLGHRRDVCCQLVRNVGLSSNDCHIG